MHTQVRAPPTGSGEDRESQGQARQRGLRIQDKSRKIPLPTTLPPSFTNVAIQKVQASMPFLPIILPYREQEMLPMVVT